MKDGCIARPETQPEIPRMMDGITDRVSMLRTAVNELKVRLQPISLREPPEEPSEKKDLKEACATDLGNYLLGTINQLDYITKDIVDATERMQL